MRRIKMQRNIWHTMKLLCCFALLLAMGISMVGCGRAEVKEPAAAGQENASPDEAEKQDDTAEQDGTAEQDDTAGTNAGSSSAEATEAGNQTDGSITDETQNGQSGETTPDAADTGQQPELSDTQPEPEELPPAEPEPAEIDLLMVGDMLMHEKVMDSGLQDDGSYSFRHIFAQVEDHIREADLALVNQETIIGGTEIGLSGYPCFNSPFELGEAEVEVGFDVILHGTNHALDRGSKGLLRCLDFWDSYAPELPYLGVNRSEEQEDELYIYEQDGMKIAILNYTYGTNGINPPADMPYLVDYLEEDKVREDLARAEAESDFTVVCPHWGTEYNLGISQNQEWWTQIFLEGGADLVIGTHPHVIEPIEWVRDEAGNEMLVYYSLGNFVNGTAGTGAGIMNRCVGGMAEVTLQKADDGSVKIADYGVVPLVCHISWGSDYTVYELSDYTQELAEENRIRESDAAFSLESCQALVEKVWGEAGVLE